MNIRDFIVRIIFTVSLSVPVLTQAEIIGGIEFPDGALSFADLVVSYDPLAGGGPAPTDPNFLTPQEALGVPDYVSPIGSVSLGRGGTIILQFTDNRLTGSDDPTPDLHIFEIGPQVEDTFVAIIQNGTDWVEIGKVFGATSSIDIDQFGFGTDDEFSFVRLIDDFNEGGATGATVGADIDAVGAISTVAAPVPVPAALPLFGFGMMWLARASRRKHIEK